MTPPARQHNDSLKLGIIGCGWVTEARHLPALRRLKGAEVVAFSDISTERLNKVASLFHVKDRYSDYQQLLRDRSIDAVAVCVPTQHHAEVALSALDAGKHVFIEKPLALQLEQSKQLIERARKSSCKVMVGFNMRWHRLVRQSREIIGGGSLGPLELMRTVLTARHETVPEWRKRRQLGGGVLFELAVHHFDLWRFLLRSEVEEILATSRSGPWDDETATVTARMANGVLVTSAFSERTNENNEIDIYGQAGRLHVSCYHFDGLECFSSSSFPGDGRTRLRQTAHALKELPRGIWGMRKGGDFLASYGAQWRHFMAAIRDDTPVECSLEDGERALQVVLAAAASAALRQPIKIANGARTPRATATASALEARNRDS